MINNLFYSNNNKEAIKSIIIEETKVKNIGNLDLIINDTMQYVSSQVSQTPPKGMKQEEYLFLMNKKVYDIILPIVTTTNSNQKSKQNSSQNIKQEIKPVVVENRMNNVFDPLLIKQFETSSNLIDYPKPSNNSIPNENIDVKIKSLEKDRDMLTPKIRPIDFTIKEENELPDTMKLYNELINNKIDPIDLLSQNNNNQFTPINLLTGNNNQSTPINDLPINRQNIQNAQNIQNTYLYSDNDSILDPDHDDSDRHFKLNKSLQMPRKNNSSWKLPTNNNNSDTVLASNNIDNNFNLGLNNMNIQQSYNLEFSDVNPKNSKIMLDEPKFNIIEKKYFVIFDSADRDLFEYPIQTVFQVKFSPAGNNFLYENFYDTNDTLILRERVIVQGDASNASVNETFDNIKTIECTNLTVPTAIVNLGKTDVLDTTGGTNINIYSEPYLFLVIPEIKGTYIGGNLLTYQAFAKLRIEYSANTNTEGTLVDSDFTILRCDEVYNNSPVSLGKMDKMTLNLTDKNGKPFNFGIDKLFIEEFKPGEMRYNSICGDKYLTTIITIQNKNDQYKKYCQQFFNSDPCNLLNSHNVVKGDLLYFYDTVPNFDQVALFEDYVKISKMKINKTEGEITIYLHYPKIVNGEEKNIQLSIKNLFQDNTQYYYFVIFNKKTNKYYFLKIFSVTDKYITVKYLDNMPQFKDYSTISIGVAKANLRGSNTQDIGSVFNSTGYYVLNVGNTLDTLWDVEINFPYEKLPEYLKDPNIYTAGETFFIQKKMQVTYNFTFTSLIKDYQQVESQLNESGNN